MHRQFYLSNHNVPAQNQQTFARRYLLAGFLIMAVPLLAIAYQSYKINSGTVVRLPVSISSTKNMSTFGVFPKLKLTTPLNTIDTKDVAGQNDFSPSNKIFVFLSPGPSDIWYPYAVSKRPPEQKCLIKQCLVLSGMVTKTDQNLVHIRYQYENFVPSDGLIQKYSRRTSKNPHVSLSIGKDGRAIVNALHIGGETLTQRKIEMPELFGFTNNIANTAPVK